MIMRVCRKKTAPRDTTQNTSHPWEKRSLLINWEKAYSEAYRISQKAGKKVRTIPPRIRCPSSMAHL